MARGSVGGAYRGKHGNIRGNFRGGARGGFRPRGAGSAGGRQNGGKQEGAAVLVTDDGGTAREYAFYMSNSLIGKLPTGRMASKRLLRVLIPEIEA